MRALKLSIAILATITLRVPVQADQPQRAFDPSLRSYSKMVAIIADCGQAYPVNVERAKAYASAFLEIAQKAGARRSDVTAEYKRRASEVQITGARPWCMAARAGLRETGAAELFPTQ